MSDTTGTDGDADDLLREVSWLRRLARSLVRDDATADDVVQDTLVAAVEHPPRDERSLRGWLAAVARNAARRRHRSDRRRSGREAAVARPEATAAEAETSERLETCRALLAAVDALEEPYRTAVRLRWIDGLPPRDVAARLGVSPEVAWKRLSRGLAMLRARLDRERGGRRAWIVAVADLGRVRPQEVPLAPLAAAAAATVPLTVALAVLVAVLTLGGAWTVLLRAGGGTAGDDGSGDVATARSAEAEAALPGAPRRPHGRAARPVGDGRRTDAEQAATSAPTSKDSASESTSLPEDRIVGRVIAPDGSPVTDAHVQRRIQSSASGGREAATDADGRFVLPHPADRTSIGTLWIHAPPWADDVRGLPRLTPGLIDVGEIRLGPATPIGGVVVDEEGRPVPQLSVSVRRAEGAAVYFSCASGEDGRFRFGLTGSGEWVVSAFAGDRPERWARPYVQRTVAAGTDDVRITFRHRDTGRARLTVEVVDAAGARLDFDRFGMRALPVATFEQGDDVSSGVTWDRGGDRLRRAVLRPGTWTVWAKAKGLPPASTSVRVETWDTEVRARVVARPAGKLRVVVDWDGDAPRRPGFVVAEAVGASGEVPTPYGDPAWHEDGAANATLTEQPDGSYAGKDFAPGRVRLRLQSSGWWAPETTVDVLPGETTTARVVARPGGFVAWEGTVTEGSEAELSFARDDGTFVPWCRVPGMGRRCTLAHPMPAFPPGRVRWRIRVAAADRVAPDLRPITTIEGEAIVPLGGSVSLPEGPFSAPDER